MTVRELIIELLKLDVDKEIIQDDGVGNHTNEEKISATYDINLGKYMLW